jgi:Kef-type K+ transport system membrane component KefB
MNLAEHLPHLTSFALCLLFMLTLPRLMQRLGLPGPIGFILTGIVLGPQVLGVLKPDWPVLVWFAEMGKLLLMFLVGFDIELSEFARARNKSALFGAFTFACPFLLGVVVARIAGYSWNACALVGSILAPHTLLGLPMVKDAGLSDREPVLVTVGGTVLTDILSILVLAICLSIHLEGFSAAKLAIQLVELAIYVPAVLFGLSWIARFFLRRYGTSKSARIVILFMIMAAAAQGAEWIHLEGIIGALLAGIAAKSAFEGTPTEDTLEVISHSLFIPAFFIAAGFLIDFKVFFNTLSHGPLFVAVIVGGLLAAKWLAAQGAGRLLGYPSADRRIMFALSVPHVAATLAVALVAYGARNAAGERLIDEPVLNTTIVLVIVTSFAGLVWAGRASAAIRTAEGVSSPSLSSSTGTTA